MSRRLGMPEGIFPLGPNGFLRKSWLSIIALSTISCGHIDPLVLNAPARMATEEQKAKNVILFVGDGMGISTVTAIRILDGQLRGETGEENILSWETFPHVALSKTYNTNQQVSDSAGTATALLTGVKTKAGFVSVGPDGQRGNCEAALANPLPTLFERAGDQGLATGIVTTARLTHATPAAAYAHTPERDWESDADMPEEIRAAGCVDIARQLVEFKNGAGLDVALGGGRENFLPLTAADPEWPDRTGKRIDKRNLISEWLEKPDAVFVWHTEQFSNLDLSSTRKLLGLFEPKHMQFELDRDNDAAGEPSLSEMTAAAINMLHKNQNGYVLLVEGGRIDHGHHAGRAAYALHDGVEFANAVAIADRMTDDKETLIIVTADHSHVFTLAGYPTRGNPILGKVIGNDDRGDPEIDFSTLSDGLPYTTLGYHNGPGAVAATPRPDLTDIDTTDANFRQQALIPRADETHGGEDVAIYAKGPGAEGIHGVMEQNEIYDVMFKALSANR